MDTTPLVQQTQPSHQSMTTTVFKSIVRKNIRIMFRDKAALKRESFITVVYFGLLIVLKLSGSPVPPVAPGHVVNPAFTATTLSDPIDSSLYSSNSLISEYVSGRTHIAVAPCGSGVDTKSKVNPNPSQVLTDLESNYPALRDMTGVEFPLNWTCFPTKEALLEQAHEHSNILAGIVFDDQDSTLLTYELHFNHTLTPSNLVNFSASAGIPVNSTQVQWLESGIVALQHSIQMSVTRVSAAAAAAAASSKKPKAVVLVESLTFRQEPFDDYIDSSNVFNMVSSIAPMYYVIIAGITSQSWMKVILEEKEKQVCLLFFFFIIFFYSGGIFILIKNCRCLILFIFVLFISFSFVSAFWSVASP